MKLFISYARVDMLPVKEIIKKLESAGHEIWYDQKLLTGQEWWSEIENRLDWCEGLIYLLSPESIESEFCQNEYNVARKHEKKIYPVRIQGNIKLPDWLSHIQYADLSQGMERIPDLLNVLTIAESQLNLRPPSQESSPTSFLKDVFISWTLSGDLDEAVISAFTNILSNAPPVDIMNSWIDTAKELAAKELDMLTSDFDFLVVDLTTGTDLHGSTIEDSFHVLWKKAVHLNEAHNMARIRLAMISIFGENHQQELIGLWK